MTDANPENHQWLHERFARLLSSAVDRDADEVIRLLSEVADEMGTHGVYALCCALAEAVRQFAFPQVPRGDGSLTGDMLAIEQLSGMDSEPDALWASRFVVAYVNGDSETSTALFFGSIKDEEAHTGGVVALIGMAADLGRQRLGTS